MTRYSVSIDPDAEIKISKATNWYNCLSPGLGDKFRDQLKIQLDSLEKYPQRHAIRYRNARRVSMKNHPYTIDYIVYENRGTVGYPRLRRFPPRR